MLLYLCLLYNVLVSQCVCSTYVWETSTNWDLTFSGHIFPGSWKVFSKRSFSRGSLHFIAEESRKYWENTSQSNGEWQLPQHSAWQFAHCQKTHLAVGAGSQRLLVDCGATKQFIDGVSRSLSEISFYDPSATAVHMYGWLWWSDLETHLPIQQSLKAWNLGRTDFGFFWEKPGVLSKPWSLSSSPVSQNHTYANLSCISGHHAIDLLPDYQTTRRLVEKEMVCRYTDSAGESRICGGRDLKSSQAYPKGCLDQVYSWAPSRKELG